MVRWKGSTRMLNYSSKCTSIISKVTGQTGSPSLNLPTTIGNTRQQRRPHSSSTPVDTQTSPALRPLNMKRTGFLTTQTNLDRRSVRLRVQQQRTKPRQCHDNRNIQTLTSDCITKKNPLYIPSISMSHIQPRA